jgi:hypothetical protein
LIPLRNFSFKDFSFPPKVERLSSKFVTDYYFFFGSTGA